MLAYEEAQRYEAELVDVVEQRDRMEAELVALQASAVRVVAAGEAVRQARTRQARRTARWRLHCTLRGLHQVLCGQPGSGVEPADTEAAS